MFLFQLSFAYFGGLLRKQFALVRYEMAEAYHSGDLLLEMVIANSTVRPSLAIYFRKIHFPTSEFHVKFHVKTREVGNLTWNSLVRQ